MKKNIIKSAIISLIITSIGCLANFLCAKLGDFLLIRVSSDGGEYTGEIGFGILLEKFYPLTDDPSVGTIRHLSFSIVNFLLYLVIIFIIVFATTFVINKIKEGKKKDKKKNNKKEK